MLLIIIAFLLLLDGDHSIAIGSALASIKCNDNLGIIWFDAHGDFHTFDTTISGNIHGLPLAAITGYEKRFLADFHTGNFYNFKNTVIVGARDLEPEEIENTKKAGITVFSTEDIKRFGVKSICDKAFKIASANTNGIHISYDIDLIDPNFAPGVSVPAVSGINLEDAFSIIDYIIENKNIIKSMDLVEFNPLQDIDHKTEIFSKNILKKLSLR